MYKFRGSIQIKFRVQGTDTDLCDLSSAWISIGTKVAD